MNLNDASNIAIDIPRYNLDTCFMLVEFNASVWTARKLDKGTTEEVRQAKGAKAKGAARVNKHLLAGTTELDAIIAHIQKVRGYVTSVTVPWADRGTRMLRNSMFLEFDENMKKFEDETVVLVNDFINIYPSLITAQAMALGQMFNRAEFPDVNEVAKKFKFKVVYTPLPTAGDFRVDVGNAAQAELKARLDEVYAERITVAVGEVRERLTTAITHLAEQLTVSYADGKPKGNRFYESTLETAKNLCAIVPALNITNDPKIEEVRADLERIIGGITADVVRDDFPAREELKREMDSLVSRLDF